MPSGGNAPHRDQIRQEEWQAFDLGKAFLPDGGKAVNSFSKHICERSEITLGRRALLAALIQNLHESAKADRDQEGNNQSGYGTAQRGLRHQ